MKRQYEYRTVRFTDFVGLTSCCDHSDAYTSEDAASIEIRELRESGFRVSHITPDFVIFERVKVKYPAME